MQEFREQSLSFEGFTLDLTRGCLLRGDEEVKLRPKTFEVLKFLVGNDRKLISKEQLIAAVWPNTAVTDDSLVQCLIEIRRSLGDKHQEIIKTVPRRGYVFQSEVIAHQPAERKTVYSEEVADVRLSVDEEHIEFGRIPKALNAPASKQPFRIWTFILVSVAFILIATAAAVYRQRAKRSENLSAPVHSIAVLPLKNLTGDAANEYFVDGLTEAVINALSHIEGLKVISRGSVFSFKDGDVEPRQVGSRLDVETVLEGSVRKDANSVRVAVRLVNTDDGRILWSADTHDKTLSDLFALQDDIARSLVAGLRVKLTGESERKLAQHHTQDIEAYQLYMKGRYFWNKRTEDGLKKSLEYFEQAIAKDQRFALAHAGLADSYAVFNLYSIAQLPEALPRARDAAQHALGLDDSLAEAHTVLALVKEQYDWDWEGAEREFQKAIELNPNYATAHQYYSEFLAFRGRTEESLAQIKEAHDLDPMSLIINTTLGYPYLCARQCDRALEEFRKAREMDPNFFLAIFYTARCYELESLHDQAIAEYQRAVSLSKGSSLALAGLGHAYARSGSKDQARGILRELTAMSTRRYVSPYLIGTVYAGLGENDQAFQWLEKARLEHDYSMVLLGIDARLDGLRGDARFASLQRSVRQ